MPIGKRCQGGLVASRAVLSPDDKTAFLEEARAMWRHERPVDLGAWCYLDAGVSLWQEFTKHADSYYVNRSEAALIARHAPEIGALVRKGLDQNAGVILGELGPGSRHAVRRKTWPMVAAVDPDLYVAADHAAGALDEAQSVLKELRPALPVRRLEIDFNRAVLPLPEDGRRVVVQFGSTIGNVSGWPGGKVPPEALRDALTVYRKSLRRGDYLVIGYDANQDEESLIAAYGHPLSIAFGENLLSVMAAHLPMEGFKIPDFRYVPSWHPDSHLMAFELVAQADGSFRLDGERIAYRKGERFNFLGAYKYPVAMFRAEARRAGLEPVRAFLDDQKRVGLHVLAVA